MGCKDGDLLRLYSPEPSSTEGDFLFDLASLSKLISTAMLTLRLCDLGILSLNQTLSLFLENPPRDKADITIQQLLTHTGGFESHWMLEKSCPDPCHVVTDILTHPLNSRPGTRVCYSCMGYILLGFIIEKAMGAGLVSLARDLVFSPLTMNDTCYLPVGAKKKRTQPTEWNEELGCYIRGVVHDENARFFGGISGNAGLFSSINDLSLFARMLLQGGEGFLGRETFELFRTGHTPGLGSSRGLGVEIKEENISWQAGPCLSNGSYGHTGFTGTSLYVDPSRDLFFILLTNRVYYGRNSDIIPRYRSLYHQYVLEDYCKI